jgi:3-oxoacyl-[acyl-carrier-protein] synthase II
MAEAWITGIGLVTALGSDRETTWHRVIRGESGIAPLTLFDTLGFRTSIAAQVPDVPSQTPSSANLRHTSRASRFAFTATAEALLDAGLAPAAEHPRPWGLAFGGGTAGLFEAESFYARRLTVGPRARGLSEFVEMPQDCPTDRVAERFHLCGNRLTVTTACSSATIALGLAAELVREGELEIVLAGGTDAISRLTYAGFNSLRAVDPDGARPFDIRRKGLTIGEGAAVLVVESSIHARARGARSYAEVLGYGVTNDAFHMTQPEPSGAAWERTVRAALDDANVDANRVDYINAHGTATEQNDAAECAAYARVFGARLSSIPVSSVKGAIGHCLSVAGGMEAALTALAIQRGQIPPTARFGEPDPACPVDAVAGCGRTHAVSVALSSSFAFGGNSSVIVLGKST